MPHPRRDGRRILALAATLLLALAAGARAAPMEPGAAQAGARAAVAETVDAVLTILRDEDLSHEAKLDKIEALAYERFDFETISKLVLARNWRRFSKEQRAEFTAEFKRHLSLTYGKSIEEYTNEDVEITGTRLERNGDVTVRTRLMGRGPEPIQIDYRLREKLEQWSVIDVIIEGVSLISNFRSQTQEVIGKKGPEGLIEALREKNAKREVES